MQTLYILYEGLENSGILVSVGVLEQVPHANQDTTVVCFMKLSRMLDQKTKSREFPSSPVVG